MRAAAGACSAKRKSSAREAHLTGALGHGRFYAGAKMTDKRRAAKSRMQLGNYAPAFRRSNPADDYVCEMSRISSAFSEDAMNSRLQSDQIGRDAALVSIKRETLIYFGVT